jgi:hypothetical protein
VNIHHNFFPFRRIVVPLFVVLAGVLIGTPAYAAKQKLPTLSLANAKVTESNAAKKAYVVARLSRKASRRIVIRYAVIPRTGSAADLKVAVKTATIKVGKRSVALPLIVTGDKIKEKTETFTIRVISAKGVRFKRRVAAFTIFDNDSAAAPAGTPSPTPTPTPPPLPIASIADVSGNEGNAGTPGKLTITVTLDSSAPTPVSVALALAGGSATAGTDFNGPVGGLTLLIPAGSTTAAVDIPFVGDSVNELDETFNITLTSASGADLGTAAAVGTIVNDDPLPQVQGLGVNSTQQPESVGSFGVGAAVNGISDRPATVTATIAAVNAKNFSDDVSLCPFPVKCSSVEVVIPPGAERVPNATMYFNDDALDEIDETFTLTFSNPVNVTWLGWSTLTVKIQDNDGQPHLFIGNPSPSSMTEGGTFNFPVSLTAASGRDITLDYQIDHQGSSVNDIVEPSPTLLVIPAGQTTANIAIPTVNDNIYEIGETFSVNPTTVDGATNFNLGGIATITDNDPVPKLQLSTMTVMENDATGKGTVYVSLTNPSYTSTPFSILLNGGTATSGSDFVGTSWNGTIPAEQSIVGVPITLIDDSADEDFAETLGLLPGSGSWAAGATGQLTIFDDDPRPLLSIADAAPVIEGNNLQFTVSRNSSASNLTITVHVATQIPNPANSTYAQSDDYIAVNQTLTFLPGETSKVVSVHTWPDIDAEGNEVVLIGIDSPVNAGLDVKQTAQGTILANGAE